MKECSVIVKTCPVFLEYIENDRELPSSVRMWPPRVRTCEGGGQSDRKEKKHTELPPITTGHKYLLDRNLDFVCLLVCLFL